MDTVNAKKRWTAIYWRVNKLFKNSHIVSEPHSDGSGKRASIIFEN
jgi:hypothetical protein